MARDFNIEGTKAYFWWAIILLAIGLWHLKDGWFPTESILMDHPSPSDSYYMYNKIVAVVGVVGSMVCGYIHRIVR